MAKKKEKMTEQEKEINEQGTEAEATAEAPEKEVKEENSELAKANDRFLRLAADFENFKKHTAAEKEKSRSIIVSDTVKMMLPILDDLERAVESAKNETSAIKEGVEKVLQKAISSFEAYGITAFGKRGEDFDPQIHNAIMTCADEDLGEGKIAEVLQKGYKINDTIIRYALVKVSE